jgi:ribonuclease VapC
VILDSSAIVAILLRETGHETLLQQLAGAQTAAVGAPTLTDCGIVLSARLGAQGRTLLARFVQEAALAVVPFTNEHYTAALDAYLRYGKGRHAAALNFGDCMTYATARLAGAPLLCVGEDFARTDLALVGQLPSS